MKIVRVQYTTGLSYVERNKANIQAVVDELNTLKHPGIRYSTYLLPDGKTFMHLDHFESEEAHLVLQGLPSFRKFAAELEESDLEAEPQLEILSLVASTEKF